MSLGTEVVVISTGARGIVVARYAEGYALVLDDITCRSSVYPLTDLRRA
jgi:hypothetical protein